MQDRQKSNSNKLSGKKVQGIIEITRRGTGFLPFSAEASKGAALDDIEIAKEDLGGALNGDEVEVEITGMKLPAGRKALTGAIRPHGKVLRVIKRNREEFVATLKLNDGLPAQTGHLVAIPVDPRFYRPISLVRSPMSDQKENDKVVVRLVSFDGKTDPVGEIVSKLGTAGEHRTEMNAIVLENGFATEFP